MTSLSMKVTIRQYCCLNSDYSKLQCYYFILSKEFKGENSSSTLNGHFNVMMKSNQFLYGLDFDHFQLSYVFQRVDY